MDSGSTNLGFANDFIGGKLVIFFKNFAERTPKGNWFVELVEVIGIFVYISASFWRVDETQEYQRLAIPFRVFKQI